MRSRAAEGLSHHNGCRKIWGICFGAYLNDGRLVAPMADHQKLNTAVAHLSERYSNAVSLFEWAETEEANADLPRLSLTFTELREWFYGSCLHRLDTLGERGFAFDYLHSTHVEAGKRSVHRAALCNDEGEDVFVDAQFCNVVIPLRQIFDAAEPLTKEMSPTNSGGTTICTLQRVSDHIFSQEKFQARRVFDEFEGISFN